MANSSYSSRRIGRRISRGMHDILPEMNVFGGVLPGHLYNFSALRDRMDLRRMLRICFAMRSDPAMAIAS
jgi:hypothetical protein